MSDLRGLIARVRSFGQPFVCVSLQPDGLRWFADSWARCQLTEKIYSNCKVMTAEQFIEKLQRVIDAR